MLPKTTFSGTSIALFAGTIANQSIARAAIPAPVNLADFFDCRSHSPNGTRLINRKTQHPRYLWFKLAHPFAGVSNGTVRKILDSVICRRSGISGIFFHITKSMYVSSA